MNAHEKVILLVEDNRDDEELTIMALEESRVSNKIVVARDGAEAVEYLFGQGRYQGRNPTETPQVILLDLKLPKLSGLEVLERLRNNPNTRHVPVVILTTSKEEQDIVSGYSLGANSYIRKPVDYAKFAAAVKDLSLYWLVLNESPTRPKG